MEQLMENNIWPWIVIALVMIFQSTWLFTDARKRGSVPWFWAIWGLIQFPLPLIVYWIVVRIGLFQRKQKK